MHAHRDVSLPRPSISLSSQALSSSSVSESHARHAARLSIGKNMTNRYRRRVISIDVLPDDVLLEIFDFYVGEDLLTWKGMQVDMWRTLVHVCRRWRSLVFGSPRRLKLRLVCEYRTPTRKTMDIWPALPLIVCGHVSSFVADNLVAALERRDRVCKIVLIYYTNLEPGKFWAAMQEPFPELRHLCLEARSKASFEDPELRAEWELLKCPGEQDIPDSFLGGSAPRLQFFRANVIRLQGLQKLLLSATRLIELHLIDIPDYISSERMATCLSVLTSLQTLSLSFQRPYPPYKESRHSSPPTRTVLPALRHFQFTGVSKFLENLMARIDAPELNKLSITFNHRVSNTSELAQFVSRTPKLGMPYEARMVFHDFRTSIRFRLPSQIFDHELLDVGISSGDTFDIPTSEELESQVLCLAQICASLLPTVSTVEDLYIYESQPSALDWRVDEDMESTQWLKLLRSFIALKNLYLYERFASRIASALEDLDGGSITEDLDEGSSTEDLDEGSITEDLDEGSITEELDEGSITELLPSLQNIFVQRHRPSGRIHEGIRQFIAARRLIGHPIAVCTWDVKYDETL